MKLSPDFYLRDDVVAISNELLGKVLCTQINDELTRIIITETEAYAGVLSASLGFDGKPAIPAIPCADMLTSMMGLAAVLMALLRRKETNEGDYIDLAMMDSFMA